MSVSMNESDLELLKSLIDRYGFDAIVNGIAAVCDDETGQLVSSWQDIQVAKDWGRSVSTWIASRTDGDPK